MLSWDCICRSRQAEDAAVWVMPHQPFIAEAYISGYEGDLYDTYLTIQNMNKLNREDLKGLYDKAWHERIDSKNASNWRGRLSKRGDNSFGRRAER